MLKLWYVLEYYCFDINKIVTLIASGDLKKIKKFLIYPERGLRDFQNPANRIAILTLWISGIKKKHNIHIFVILINVLIYVII